MTRRNGANYIFTCSAMSFQIEFLLAAGGQRRLTEDFRKEWEGAWDDSMSTQIWATLSQGTCSPVVSFLHPWFIYPITNSLNHVVQVHLLACALLCTLRQQGRAVDTDLHCAEQEAHGLYLQMDSHIGFQWANVRANSLAWKSGVERLHGENAEAWAWAWRLTCWHRWVFQ